MGREGAKQDTHLFTTQWHDKTDKQGQGDFIELTGSWEFAHMPGVSGEVWRLSIWVSTLMRTSDTGFFMNFYQTLAVSWWMQLLVSRSFMSPAQSWFPSAKWQPVHQLPFSLSLAQSGVTSSVFCVSAFYLPEIHSIQHKQICVWPCPWNMSASLHNTHFHQIPQVCKEKLGNCVLEAGFTDFTIYYRRQGAQLFLLSELIFM